MRLAPIARALGGLLGALAGLGLLPLLCDGLDGQPIRPWLVMIGVASSLSALLWWLGARQKAPMGLREGIAVTTLIWIAASLVGAIGIWLASPADYIGSCFEAMSGLTTTGGSVFGGAAADPLAIESQTRGVLLWRALLNGLGGIGIVVMSLALLPMVVGGSGFQMYRAEVSGIDRDRLTPRIADTARILLRVYLGLILGVYLGLLLCGVSHFDAVCHALAAVATGGFSTYDDSAEGLGSAAAEWVLIAGMVAGGLNFALLVHAVRGKPLRLWRSGETRLYLGILTLASAGIGLSLWLQSSLYQGRGMELVRDSVFQVVTIATTTGFGTGYDVDPASYDAWPPLCQMILLVLMVLGGCAGSTSGGIKMVRLLVALKSARRELHRFIEPARVIPVQLDGQVMRDGVVLQVAGFLIVFACCWAVGSVALAACGSDPLTAISAAVACLSNIGPGLGLVGPADNYRSVGPSGQIICFVLMLIGRLELLGVLMLLRPGQWRR